MVERHIIRRYELLVYSDGSVETFELEDNIADTAPSFATNTILNQNSTMDEFGLELVKCSSRIGQILTVLVLTYRAQSNIGFNNKQLNKDITDAFKKTAAIYGVSLQSVQDKVSRQLDMQMGSFRNYVYDFIIYHDNHLFDILLDKISVTNAENDKIAIKKFQDNPNLKVKMVNEMII